MLFGRKARLGPTRGYLMIPVDGAFECSQVADSARQLVQAAYDLAQALIDGPLEILAVHAKTRQMWRFSDGVPFRLSRLAAGGVHVLMNVGFLLSDTAPIAALIQQAQEQRIAWCGVKSTDDTHACAFTVRWLVSSVTTRWLWQALTYLTACIDDDVEGGWQAFSRDPLIAPSQSHIEHSPAMRQVVDVWGRRWADSPRFLNTAFKEIISRPQSRISIGRDPNRMAEALEAQRNTSRVPWIFNTLLNEIEYRLGSIRPRSFPPEIHLSLTGRCDIECRFCAYTHDSGRLTFVEPAQMARMDFLRHVQALRLNSGLGEPTLNRHLPAIIEYVSTHYPHVGLNFFTNGMTLNRPGLIEAIVGNVRWINISVNAATRESWKAQCKSDQFERVCNNLRELHRAKLSRRALGPLVYGSMVLTRASLQDLPCMPALCRELGIDRFVAIPYFGLGYNNPEKYGGEMTLAACREQYDALYWKTVGEAKIHDVSLEAPLPSDQMRIVCGLEVRGFYDFARIETREWTLGQFLTGLQFDKPAGTYCHFLWRQGTIGSTNNASHTPHESHYMYPCLGPLAIVDLSRTTPFRFSEGKEFFHIWQGPLFSHLRRAQHVQRVCEVCDFCRQHDTRDPKGFALLESLVARFSAQHCGGAEEKSRTTE